MARRSSSGPPPPPPEIKRFTNREEIDRAIEKLKRRLSEVQRLAGDRIRHDDERQRNVAANIRQSILEIFGPTSLEYRDHEHFSFDLWVMGGSDAAEQPYFEGAVARASTTLQGLIERLEERREEFAQEDPSARVRAAFEGLELHPRIAARSADLYRGGHYRNAVLDGYLALENFIKEKSRCRDRDGVKLMEYVFSKDQPVLAFNALADEADRDEQRGFMHMFQGAAFALRNPRAHSLLIDSPEQGLEYLTLLSLLANLVERARRVRDP